jgi:hypothetical protein
LLIEVKLIFCVVTNGILYFSKRYLIISIMVKDFPVGVMTIVGSAVHVGITTSVFPETASLFPMPEKIIARSPVNS